MCTYTYIYIYINIGSISWGGIQSCDTSLLYRISVRALQNSRKFSSPSPSLSKYLRHARATLPLPRSAIAVILLAMWSTSPRTGSSVLDTRFELSVERTRGLPCACGCCCLILCEAIVLFVWPPVAFLLTTVLCTLPQPLHQRLV